MTTQAGPDIPERVSRLEGAYEQANERFNDQTQAINALRADNQAEHQSLRAEIGELRTELRAEIGQLRTELHAEIGQLRAEMHRQTYVVIAVLGGLVTLLRFIG